MAKKVKYSHTVTYVKGYEYSQIFDVAMKLQSICDMANVSGRDWSIRSDFEGFELHYYNELYDRFDVLYEAKWEDVVVPVGSKSIESGGDIVRDVRKILMDFLQSGRF